MSNLRRISASTLKSWLEDPQISSSLAIVDVRDEDRIGVSLFSIINILCINLWVLYINFFLKNIKLFPLLSGPYQKLNQCPFF